MIELSCRGTNSRDRAAARRVTGACHEPRPGDGENHLIGITASGLTETLSYDPVGRLSRTVANGAPTNFLWDGEDMVAEYDDGGNILRRFLHGPGVDNPMVWFEGSGVTAANERNLIADHQGSIIGYSDSTGTVPAGATYAYDPYGSPTNWAGPRFRYTGQMALPEAQLYYYKARFYHPVAERFLQTDPVGYDADMNPYGYVREDPVDRNDPTGLDQTNISSGPTSPGASGSPAAKPTSQQQSSSAAPLKLTTGLAGRIVSALNKLAQGPNSSAHLDAEGTSISMHRGTGTDVTAAAKTPAGSGTVNGSISSESGKVSFSGVKISTPVGDVKSAPTQVIVAQSKNGSVTTSINKPLVIKVMGITIVNIGAGQHQIPH